MTDNELYAKVWQLLFLLGAISVLVVGHCTTVEKARPAAPVCNCTCPPQSWISTTPTAVQNP